MQPSKPIRKLQVPKNNCQGDSVKKAKLKKTKLEGEKECMCIYIHSHTCALYTHAFACVNTGCLLEIPKKWVTVTYKRGTWRLGNRGERKTFQGPPFLTS